MKTRILIRILNSFVWNWATLLIIFSFITAIYTMPEIFQKYEVVPEVGSYYQQSDSNNLLVNAEHPRASFLLKMWGRIEFLLPLMILALLMEFWLKNRAEIENKFIYSQQSNQDEYSPPLSSDEIIIDWEAYTAIRDKVLLYFNKIKEVIKW